MICYTVPKGYCKLSLSKQEVRLESFILILIPENLLFLFYLSVL